MKTIDTLADDIKGLFGATVRGGSSFEEEVLAKFGASVAMHVADSMEARSAKRKPNTLYMSEIGKPCKRQLWYSVHWPELGEGMQGHTLFKFLYGNIIEETALLLAEAAGHTVEHRQERVEFPFDGWTVVGRMDAVIDGVMVDVKGVSPFGYKKFVEGLTDENDSFGYRAQLSGYNIASIGYERQGFLAIDKQNGHVGYFDSPYLDIHDPVVDSVAAVKMMVEPPRRFGLVPDGKSGNEKLGTECSYCPFKATCWRDANEGAGLKAYAYSYGPVFLGTVNREPKVPQIPLAPSPVGAYEVMFQPVPTVAHPPITKGVLRDSSESSAARH